MLTKRRGEASKMIVLKRPKRPKLRMRLSLPVVPVYKHLHTRLGEAKSKIAANPSFCRSSRPPRIGSWPTSRRPRTAVADTHAPTWPCPIVRYQRPKQPAGGQPRAPLSRQQQLLTHPMPCHGDKRFVGLQVCMGGPFQQWCGVQPVSEWPKYRCSRQQCRGA